MVFSVPKPPPYTRNDENKDRDSRSPANEVRFRCCIEQLRAAIDAYKAAKNRNCSEQELEEHEGDVLKAMYDAAEAAEDPEVKAHYREKARKFKDATRDEKESMMRDTLKGLLLILAAPFALAAAAIVVAGGILYGAGTLVRGIGHTLSFGIAKAVTARKGGKKEAKNDKESWDSE